MIDFKELSPRLAKNPLGIIALFIVLIYGFAALVVGVSGDSVLPDQKWPLIWFLVLFPLVVLLAFVWLVVNHHTKLYGPTDFKDETNFFGLHTPDRLSTIRDYNLTLEAQLKESKKIITELEQSSEGRDDEIAKAKAAYLQLDKYRELIKTTTDENVVPDLVTVVSSSSASQQLAEATATSTPVTKEKLLDVLKASSP